ncbi:MAG: flagellar export protein FliJ [Armatimonadetes bacterium]|nr:flagellar export protein FliJ [Armatimonadota bacterium]
MRKFEFRLQRVLEYRELQEGWAKEAYLGAQAARLRAEDDLAKLRGRREDALLTSAPSLVEIRDLDRYLSRLEDEIEEQKSVVEILKADEEKALHEWTEARKNLKALQKLRDSAQTEWQRQADREEQKSLDDWTSMRRAG